MKLLLVAVAILFCARATYACDLSRNEEYRTCAPPCDATCDDPQLPCSLQEICATRCACPVGHVRDENKICVPKAKCPIKCPGNQVHLECVPCVRHCNEVGRICIALCTPGCGCRSGTTWNGKHCVRTEECPPKAVYNQACPVGVPVVNCLQPPCDAATCRLNPLASCVDNYCGGCNAHFYVGHKRLTDDDCNIGCQLGTANCLVNPCQFAECPAQPDAQCYSNYCGGCSAEFWYNGVQLDCGTPACDLSRNEEYRTCAPPCDATCDDPQLPCSLQEICTKRCTCPEGHVRDENKICVPKAKCPIKCPGNQVHLECVPCVRHCNEVGRICIALCTPGCGCRSGTTWNGKHCVRTEECPPKAVYNQACPVGVPVVKCIQPPCDAATCRLNPLASCVDNYCGGCNAHFYVGHKRLTDDDCNIGCQLGYANCLVNPCQFAKCPAQPDAQCFSNYCGGCSAEFWYNGVELKPADCGSTPVCNSNEEYKTCAPPCDATCKDPKLPCSLQKRCTKRCACRRGYVRDENNVCIWKAKCPKRCPYGQQRRCVTCVPTCPGPQDNGIQCKPILLTPPCIQKCVCPYGQVKVINSNLEYCILPKYCPRLRG